jgi:hypothetical protein
MTLKEEVFMKTLFVTLALALVLISWPPLGLAQGPAQAIKPEGHDLDTKLLEHISPIEWDNIVL